MNLFENHKGFDQGNGSRYLLVSTLFPCCVSVEFTYLVSVKKPFQWKISNDVLTTFQCVPESWPFSLLSKYACITQKNREIIVGILFSLFKTSKYTLYFRHYFTRHVCGRTLFSFMNKWMYLLFSLHEQVDAFSLFLSSNDI